MVISHHYSITIFLLMFVRDPSSVFPSSSYWLYYLGRWGHRRGNLSGCYSTCLHLIESKIAASAHSTQEFNHFLNDLKSVSRQIRKAQPPVKCWNNTTADSVCVSLHLCGSCMECTLVVGHHRGSLVCFQQSSWLWLHHPGCPPLTFSGTASKSTHYSSSTTFN